MEPEKRLEKQERTNTEAWQQVHMEDPERRQEEQEKSNAAQRQFIWRTLEE